MNSTSREMEGEIPPFLTIMHTYVKFRVRENGISKSTSGIQVNNYLAVSYGKRKQFRIYILKLQESIPIDFLVKETAIEFANILTETFGEFFKIWDWLENMTRNSREDIDLFCLCKWSVPNGIRMYETLETLKNQTSVTQCQMYKVMENVDVEKWTRRKNA